MLRLHVFLLNMLFFCLQMFGMDCDMPASQLGCCIMKLDNHLKQKIAQDHLDVLSIGRLARTCKELENISFQAYLAIAKDYVACNMGLDRLIKKHEYLVANKIEHDKKSFLRYNNTLNQNKEVFDRLWRYHAERRNKEIGHVLRINNLQCGVDDKIASEIVEMFMKYDSLAKRINSYRCNLSSFSSLHLACMFGFSNVVTMLLDQGVDANCLSERHGTALHVASMKGFVEIMETLLARGVNVDVVDHVGKTPLFDAAVSVLQILLDRGANVNAVNIVGSISLHNACWCGPLDEIKILLNNGANPDLMDASGFTSLSAACKRNESAAEIVKFLLEHKNGANPNIFSHENYISSPLVYACSQGKIEIIELLIHWGADVNIVNDYGDSLIHWVWKKEIIEILLRNGVDVNLVNKKNGKTPLCCACEKDNAEAIKVLLNNKANSDIADNDGKTPLFYARKNNSTEIIKLLSDSIADEKT